MSALRQSAPQSSLEPDTTGHEWDGIQEYNNPLPRWWLWTLYATILWSIGYWIVYPAWPLVTNHTRGLFGYSQRLTVMEDVAAAQAQRLALGKGLADASLEQIRTDPNLLRLALAGGRAAFGDNCASCHGAGATGGPGYPSLQDDDWLWGGTLDAIHETLRVGIRSTHADTRTGEMPAFGRDGILKRDEITAVTAHVRAIAGLEAAPAALAKQGAEVFAAQCAVCHGDAGKGNRDLGAPNLTDAIWLNGSSAAQITASIANGRKGVMPHWEGRLDPVTIKSLTVYIHSLGGGE